MAKKSINAPLSLEAATTLALMLNEKKKPLSKKAQAALVKSRIQRSVVGFLIPMMSIPKLYKLQEAAIAEGKSDEELKAIVAAFPGIVPSNI